jgi:transglutaminase-like putative cysteine protease
VSATTAAGGRQAGGVVATLAAVAAVVAEVVALTVRPLEDRGPLGPSLPPLLVVLGTAGVLALRRRRGVPGTLAVAGVVAALALALGGAAVLPVALATWIGILVAVALRTQDAGAPATAGPAGRPRLLLAGVGAGRTPAGVVTGPVAATVVVTLVAVLLLLLLGGGSSGQGPSTAGGARGASGSRPGAPGRQLSTYASGALDLTARGELPDIPALDVPATSPQLWRTGALDTYTGRAWDESDDAQLVRRGSGSVRFGPGTADPAVGPAFDETGDDPTGLPRAPGTARTASADVRLVGSAPAWLPVAAPGRLRSVDAGPATEVVQSGQRAVVLTAAAALPPPDPDAADPDEADPEEVDPYDAVVDPDLLEPPPVTGYRVTWSPRPGVHDTGLRPPAETAADLDVARLWTQLPPQVPQRVRDLAVRLTRDAADRLEAVRAVEAHVSAAAEYTLTGPELPPGADAADDLLFGSRQGFCEQFATAEAVLLRSVGIPARIATGWVGGEEHGDRRVLRVKDAHAWVEVLVPGLGWVTSDPTAGARPAPAPAQDRLTGLLRDPRTWITLAAVLLGAAATGATAVVVRRRRRRRRPRPAPLLTPAERLAAAYALAQRSLAAAGLARTPAQTLAEHTTTVVALVEAAGGPPPPEEVEAALAAVGRLLYGTAPPGDAEADRGARALSALAAAVPRLVEDAQAALTSRPD